MLYVYPPKGESRARLLWDPIDTHFIDHLRVLMLSKHAYGERPLEILKKVYLLKGDDSTTQVGPIVFTYVLTDTFKTEH